MCKEKYPKYMYILVNVIMNTHMAKTWLTTVLASATITSSLLFIDG